jgi:hypothetical protein
MKYLLIIRITVLLQTANCLLPTECSAQTWNEWFKQKKTQRKYLVEQIAALKVYLGYVKEGYQIVQRGLYTIDNIQNGNFNLHRDFFSSLKNVNPAIAKSVKMADIMMFQIGILRDVNQIRKQATSENKFTPQEIHYLSKVCSNLLFLSDANIAELTSLITSGNLEMKDDERLLRINKIYNEMQDQFAFAHEFNASAQSLSAARKENATRNRIF